MLKGIEELCDQPPSTSRVFTWFQMAEEENICVLCIASLWHCFALTLALAVNQAPAQLLSHPHPHPPIYKAETGVYVFLLLSVTLHKAKSFPGALVEQNVEVVQALSRALWSL